MKLQVKPLFASLAVLSLIALPSIASAIPITYPGPTATDSSTGAAVTTGVTVAVASVTDLDGNAVATPGAVAHIAGGNTSVVYDAAAHSEAWVTETLTASGHTFAPVVIFCSADPSLLAANGTAIAANGTTLGTIQTQTSSQTRQADMNTVLDGRGVTGARIAKIDFLTGSAYDLMFPLIALGKFTPQAVSNVPVASTAVSVYTPAPNVTDASITADMQSALTNFVPTLTSALLHAVVDGSITLKQALAINLSYNAAPYTRTKTATAQTLVFQNQAGQPLITSTTALDASGNPTGRTTVAFNNLPN